MEKHKISIIVPVYNGEKYLTECITSILNQKYQNFELLLIDDGSTDSSGKICDEYAKKDKRVRVIHKKNAGVSAARNCALEKISGKFVAFVDQDDKVMPNYFTYLHDILIKNKAEIALTPDACRFTEKKYYSNDPKKDFIEIWNGEKAAELMLYYNIIIGPWNKLISRQLIDKYCIRFNENFFGGEGFSFSIDCFCHAKKVVVGHQKLYCYRVDNSESGTTKFNLHLMKSNIEAQKYIKNNLVQSNSVLLQACKYANWHTYCDNLNTIVGCKVIKQYKEFYNDIKKVCKKDALYALRAPISKKDKYKSILYYINPYLAAKIINHFGMKKFTAK